MAKWNRTFRRLEDENDLECMEREQAWIEVFRDQRWLCWWGGATILVQAVCMVMAYLQRDEWQGVGAIGLLVATVFVWGVWWIRWKDMRHNQIYLLLIGKTDEMIANDGEFERWQKNQSSNRESESST